MAADHTKHIYQSLVANLAIAIAKGVAAAFTGSGAMLAEAIHSAADCSNQGLLLLGVKRSGKAPDDSHPLGYGRELYFWSFMVALLLFTGGGVFSIYEGIHKIGHPEPVTNVWVGIGVLAFSLLLEGNATRSNVVELNKRRGDVPFFQFLRRTKDSDLIVVFGENAAATLGLLLALGALLAAWATGDGRFDAIGSLLVGAVLILVAVFLAVEVKGLLVGEAADDRVRLEFEAVAKEDPNFGEVLRVITMQQGPGEIMVAAKIKLTANLDTAGVCNAINAFERKVRVRLPDVKWLFIEPDLEV